MRKVDRSKEPVPVSLSKRDKAGLTELERVRAYMTLKAKKKRKPANKARKPKSNKPAKEKSFKFAAYKDDEVKRSLEALFHGKCAYCETFYGAVGPVDVEHYRPKGGVSDDKSHPGYWWLAMDWENLLPSCLDCNRRREQTIAMLGPSLADLHLSSRATTNPFRDTTGKQNSFPVTGIRILPESTNYVSEAPALLDPCRDDPTEHLVYHIDHDRPFGLILPRTNLGAASIRGAASIQVYGLNRLWLVQERTRLLRRLEFLGGLVVELSAMADEIAKAPQGLAQDRAEAMARRLRLLANRTLDEMRAMTEPSEPYSELARQWLREFRDNL